MKSNVIKAVIRFLSAETFALCGFLWGSWDGYMKTLVAFVVIDYITGVIAATRKHELNSSVGFKGISKKIMIFTVVAVAHIIDTNIISGEIPLLRTMVVGMYIANEGLSILENAGRCGVPLPKKLLNFLEQLKNKGNEEEGNDNVQEENNET